MLYTCIHITFAVCSMVITTLVPWLETRSMAPPIPFTILPCTWHGILLIKAVTVRYHTGTHLTLVMVGVVYTAQTQQSTYLINGQYGKTLHLCAVFSLAYGSGKILVHSCYISPYCPLIRYIYYRSCNLLTQL